MDVLREMFPNYPIHLLQQVLQDTNSVDNAVVILLETDVSGLEEDFLEDQVPAPLPGEHLLFDEELLGELEKDEEKAIIADQKVKAVDKASDEQEGDPAADEQQDDGPQPPGLDETLATVVGVFPDVCTDHVEKVYLENVTTQGINIVDYILNSLLESKYPKVEVDNPRKRKRSTDGPEQNKFESKDRECTVAYTAIA